MGAVISTLSAPFMTYRSSLPYQGMVPSADQFVKTYGKVKFEFVQVGLKSVAVATFIANDGRTYDLQDMPAMLPEIQKLENSEGVTPEIYIEGFRLLNGAGRFWITFASTRDWRILLDQEQRRKQLMSDRDPFGEVLKWLLYLYSPLWLFSFFIVRKVRTSLGA